ncbi:fasciclin domain-containing protein [Rhizosphaericola mali]|nr:fasciclin domain-containing protein [Rhizosphaericola mali]
MIFLLSVIVQFNACRKDAFDKFYGRPDSLSAPIYQVLENRGNFKNYLKLVDKANYKNILSAQGYWTAFVPTDDAFASYLASLNLSSTDNIDSSAAVKLVRYSLVYNSYGTDHISDYQSSAGWVTNKAYKRRTAYYDYVYNDTIDGKILQVLASNRNGSYVDGDNNNKYISYFTDAYLGANNLTTYDYNYFFPSTYYNGFNIMDATVTEKDINAENGIIHTTDHVISIPLNLDQYLSAHSEYSEFKRLLNLFFVTYDYNEAASSNYKILSGSASSVYIKNYSSSVVFALNNENYLKAQDNDGQQQGWTLFVPTNNVLLDYENSFLLKYYPGKKIEELPIAVITNLINAQMWDKTVWPSKFTSTFNTLGEEVRLNPSNNIVDKKILTNGFFYGTNALQKANIFHTVYGVPFLHPAYSLFTKVLDQELYVSLRNPNLEFSLLITPDNVLNNLGYSWNQLNSTFQYTSSNGTTTIGGIATTNLKSAANNQTVYTTGSSNLDLSGKGIVESYDGEYIKYDNFKVYSSGTLDAISADKKYVQIDSSITDRTNGKVYFINGLLTSTSRNIGNHISDYALNTTAPFYYFYQYLLNSYLYNSSTGQITGTSVGSNYTVFIPTNSAILEAVKEGYLPGTVSSNGLVTPTFNPTATSDIELVTKFIQYHILDKNTIVPDGKKSGTYVTLLKNTDGTNATVKITNSLNNLSIEDAIQSSPNATIILDNSNILSNRTVIHQIDHFLHFNM